jgi:prepilin-type processing-associated H-X9-DG protein
MKTLSTKAQIKGLTLLEVLVVIAVVFILAAMILPNLAGSRKAKLPVCINNLKQIDLAILMYEEEHKQLPWQTFGVNITNASSQFGILLKYWKGYPQMFVCPSDKNKFVSINTNTLTEQNVSYFLNIDGTLTNNPSNTFLTGDRNLQADGQSVKAGLFILKTNFDMNWTREIHWRGGNLAFADGHVEFVITNHLNSAVRIQPIATNRLYIP